MTAAVRRSIIGVALFLLLLLVGLPGAGALLGGGGLKPVAAASLDFSGPNGQPDGKVDFFDLVALAQVYGKRPSQDASCAPMDLFQDNIIDLYDLTAMAKSFGSADTGGSTIIDY